MLRRPALAFALLFSLAGAANAQVATPPAQAPTADEIVAKTIAAQHLDKLKSVQTRRITATLSIMPIGVEGPLVIENKRPMKVRSTVTVMGKDNVQAYDGETGWAQMPAEERPDPQPATADELKDLHQQADIDGELLDYKSKGNSVELAGKDAVQGTDCWKLKVTLKDGDVQYQYIDAATYLPVKIEMTRTINGVPVKADIAVGDYKDESGVLMPHTNETTLDMQGRIVKQKITVQKVEVNVPIDDARFKMPAAPGK